MQQTGGSGEPSRAGLARFRSAPATWLEALLEEDDEDPLKQNQSLTQLLSGNTASRNSVAFGSSAAAADPSFFDAGTSSSSSAGFARQNSSPAEILGTVGNEGYFSNYGLAGNFDYMSGNIDVPPLPSVKTEREAAQQSTGKYSSQMKVEQIHMPSRASSMSDVDMEKLLEDSVPCRVRAKRGFATHPRSIAERVRRTKISDRIRKLQELVPNMDKQTNTADMLDEAVEYVKYLQRQIQELTEQQKNCKCNVRD